MVKYTKWVSIVFDVAESQGFDSSFADNSTAVSLAAEIWNDRKQELRSASVSTAREIAGEEVSVQ